MGDSVMTAEPYAPIPVRECAPWCTTARTPGHGDQHPHDRVCYADSTAVVTTRREVVKVDDNMWCFDHLDVVMRRPEGQDEPVIVLNDETNGLETELTLIEAQTLAATITELMGLTT